MQADLNQIVQGLNRFDANSKASNAAKTISEIRTVFTNNKVILNDIEVSVRNFKSNLNRVKAMIPTQDTKATPRFQTLMNLAIGYEDWVKYQKLNQKLAEKCLNSSGKTYNYFVACSLKDLPKTLENERLSKIKLQSAWNVWRQWQIRFGHA